MKTLIQSKLKRNQVSAYCSPQFITVNIEYAATRFQNCLGLEQYKCKYPRTKTETIRRYLSRVLPGLVGNCPVLSGRRLAVPNPRRGNRRSHHRRRFDQSDPVLVLFEGLAASNSSEGHLQNKESTELYLVNYCVFEHKYHFICVCVKFDR